MNRYAHIDDGQLVLPNLIDENGDVYTIPTDYFDIEVAEAAKDSANRLNALFS